jgi:hypothetical protein
MHSIVQKWVEILSKGAFLGTMCTALGSVISLLYVSFTVRSGSMRSFLVLSHDKVKTHKWHH